MSLILIISIIYNVYIIIYSKYFDFTNSFKLFKGDEIIPLGFDHLKMSIFAL